MLPLVVISPERGLGALKKERRKRRRKGKIKERGQMSHSKKFIEQPKFSPKSLSFRERYEKNSQRS
jgi:hypothetical protein